MLSEGSNLATRKPISHIHPRICNTSTATHAYIDGPFVRVIGGRKLSSLPRELYISRTQALRRCARSKAELQGRIAPRRACGLHQGGAARRCGGGGAGGGGGGHIITSLETFLVSPNRSVLCPRPVCMCARCTSCKLSRAFLPSLSRSRSFSLECSATLRARVNPFVECGFFPRCSLSRCRYSIFFFVTPCSLRMLSVKVRTLTRLTRGRQVMRGELARVGVCWALIIC